MVRNRLSPSGNLTMYPPLPEVAITPKGEPVSLSGNRRCSPLTNEAAITQQGRRRSCRQACGSSSELERFPGVMQIHPAIGP